jgi:hypothetical protein
MSMSGKDLLKQVLVATDLPQESLGRELAHLLDKAKCSQESLSLEDLRQILADYAQEVLLEAQAHFSK